MQTEIKGKIKYGFWGLFIGSVITMIIGFTWGDWTTVSTAQAMAEESMIASQAAICVAQFKANPDYEVRLKELSQTESWKRSMFIEKGGWDKMPGQEKADFGVSQICAEGLNPFFKSTR